MRKAILFVAIAISACEPGPASIQTPAPSVATATVRVATNAKLGQILVDGSGRTLYLFEADQGTLSTCDGSCANYWPPLLTNGAPKAGPGANASLLGTTQRRDTSVQVTYAGHPLYYVVTDHNPGDATGQAVNNFGALWYVVRPDGKQIA